MTAALQPYRTWGSIAVLVVLYAVGLVGLQTASRDWFLAATPLTLVLSAGLLVANHRDWRPAAVAAMLACVLLGFWVEVLGQSTGWVFGEYAYGATLGTRWLGVPLVIGLNWLLLAYATGTLAARLPWPWWGRAAASALGMTALDVLIEPVAQRLGFWQWAGGAPPLHNSAGWLVVSFIMAAIFQLLPFRKENPLAAGVLLLQLLFFGMLNILR
jgi:uncharacterized membrane protein